MEKSKQNEVVINEKSMEILVAKFIPTSQYFERSFDMLQQQLKETRDEQKEFRYTVDRRFTQTDNKIDSFKEELDKKIDNLKDELDNKIDNFKYELDNKIDNFKDEVNVRFEQVDKRFEQIDKKFEQVDAKFDKVNDSIVALSHKIEALTKAQEVTIRDYIIEKDRHYDGKFSNLRMFNIATISLVTGVILKMAGVISF